MLHSEIFIVSILFFCVTGEKIGSINICQIVSHCNFPESIKETLSITGNVSGPDRNVHLHSSIDKDVRFFESCPSGRSERKPFISGGCSVIYVFFSIYPGRPQLICPHSCHSKMVFLNERPRVVCFYLDFSAEVFVCVEIMNGSFFWENIIPTSVNS